MIIILKSTLRYTTLLLTIYLMSICAVKAQNSQVSGTITIPPSTVSSGNSYLLIITGFDADGFFIDQNIISDSFSAGATQTNFTINVPTDSSITDYRVRFLCLGCGPVEGPRLPTDTYFTPAGLQFFLGPENLFARNTFPTQLNFNIPEGIEILTTISLPNNELAPRDLRGLLTFPNITANFNITTGFGENGFEITLPEGINSTSFRILGLPPQTGETLEPKFECTNCDADYTVISTAEQNIPSGINLETEIMLSNQGTLVSGEVRVPDDTVTILSSRLDVVVSFYDSSSIILQSIRLDLFPSASPSFGLTSPALQSTFPFNILVSNAGNVTQADIVYACSNCDRVLEFGFFDRDTPFFNTTQDFLERDLIPIGGQDFTNINFSILPDRDRDGIVDAPTASLSPIINLVLEED